MPKELIIRLAGRLGGVTVESPRPGGGADDAEAGGEALREELDRMRRGMEARLRAEREQLRSACRAAAEAAGRLERLREELVAEAEGQLAALAVEIARKVLMQEIQAGRYEIDPIVAEALRHAPARGEVTVRLNPADLARCAAAGQMPAEGGNVRFVADGSVPPAECVLETAEGTIESSVEANLERVAEALSRPE